MAPQCGHASYAPPEKHFIFLTFVFVPFVRVACSRVQLIVSSSDDVETGLPSCDASFDRW